MTFAALEARLNAAVIRHLANAQAHWTPAGAVVATPVPVLFDALPDEALGLVTRIPQISWQLRDAPDVAEGDSVVVRGVAYVVMTIERDGTGMAMARLQVAPS